MNTTIKVVGAVVLGGAAGSVATYFISKRKIELKYAILFEDELEKIKEYYRLIKTGKGELVVNGEEPFELGTVEESSDEDDDDEVELEDIDSAVETVNNYLAVVKEYDTKAEETKTIFDQTQPSDTEIGDEIESPVPMLPEPDPDNPYIIALEQWGEQYVFNVNYDKITVRYFEDDDVVYDEGNGNIVPTKDVGAGNLAKFGFASEDAATVYVRNESIETDFEVIRDPGSYTAIILGLPTEYTEGSNLRKRIKRDDE